MAFTETRIQKILGLGSGTGGRPAAGNAGARWIDSATGSETYDDGSAWQAFTAAGAMVHLAETILGSTATNITLTSISGAYRHLRVMLVGRGDTAANQITVITQLNADTGTNYEWLSDGFSSSGVVTANGSAGDTGMTLGTIPAASSTANFAGTVDIMIYDYARTTFFKTLNCVNDAMLVTGLTGIQAKHAAGIWRSTAAVTSVKLAVSSGNLVAGSVLTLYGIL